MNINRLRPTGVKKENLDFWLSGVVHDAVRDAIEAGMPRREAYELIAKVAEMIHPLGPYQGRTEKR